MRTNDIAQLFSKRQLLNRCLDAKPLPECQSLYLFPDPTTLEEMSSTSAGDLIAELKAADAAWIVGELDVKTASGILYDARSPKKNGG